MSGSYNEFQLDSSHLLFNCTGHPFSKQSVSSETLPRLQTLAAKSMPSTPIHWSEQLTTAFKTRSQHAHLQSYNAHGRSYLQNHVMRVKTEETVIHRFQIYIPQTGLTDPRLRQIHLSLIAFCIFAWSLQHKQKNIPQPLKDMHSI